MMDKEEILLMLSDLTMFQKVVGGFMLGYFIKSIVEMITRPKNVPPFYYEFPYIPWLGSLVQFATGPREFLQRAAAYCAIHHPKANCFTIQLFGKPMTFLIGSEGHGHFFRAREHVFDIREAYAMTVITFGPGVCYDCTQQKMAQQFAFFKDGLADECFVEYMKLIQEEVVTFFDKEWPGETGEADLLQSLSDVFTLTSSRCLLGPEIRARWNDSGMAKHYLALDHSFVPILFFFPWIPNPNKSKCVAARDHFRKMFHDVMEERKKQQKSDPNWTPPKDFLQVLMNAKYKDGSSLTDTEITGIMIGVLLGGQHTSNVTGTWLLCHLLKSTSWLDTVLKEQEAIMLQDDATKKEELLHPNTLSYEDVSTKMDEFDKVLKETLRLHPPFFQLSRSVKVDSTFGKYMIPKGHFVNISPGAAHRLPELWGNDADDFDPNRFSTENSKDIKPYAWIPFGGGMHQCGGRKFAWNSLKVTLSWLLRNYEIELINAGAKELPKEDYTTMVVAPTQTHTRIRYKRRRRQA